MFVLVRDKLSLTLTKNKSVSKWFYEKKMVFLCFDKKLLILYLLYMRLSYLAVSFLRWTDTVRVIL